MSIAAIEHALLDLRKTVDVLLSSTTSSSDHLKHLLFGTREYVSMVRENDELKRENARLLRDNLNLQGAEEYWDIESQLWDRMDMS